MSWSEIRDLLKTTKSVSVRVGETEIEFFPISVGMLFAIKTLASPLAKALTSLFADTSRDYELIQRDFAANGKETVASAIPLDTLRWRAEQREKAIAQFIEAISAKENQDLIARMLMNSMRSLFPDPDKLPTSKEFFDTFSSEHLHTIFSGFFQANKGCLGPLAPALETAVAQRIKVMDGVPSVPTSSLPPAEAVSPSPTSSASP